VCSVLSAYVFHSYFDTSAQTYHLMRLLNERISRLEEKDSKVCVVNAPSGECRRDEVRQMTIDADESALSTCNVNKIYVSDDDADNDADNDDGEEGRGGGDIEYADEALESVQVVMDSRPSTPRLVEEIDVSKPVVYSKLTLSELRTIAVTRGLDVSGLKKADIVKKLEQ